MTSSTRSALSSAAYPVPGTHCADQAVRRQTRRRLRGRRRCIGIQHLPSFPPPGGFLPPLGTGLVSPYLSWGFGGRAGRRRVYHWVGVFGVGCPAVGVSRRRVGRAFSTPFPPSAATGWPRAWPQFHICFWRRMCGDGGAGSAGYLFGTASAPCSAWRRRGAGGARCRALGPIVAGCARVAAGAGAGGWAGGGGGGLWAVRARGLVPGEERSPSYISASLPDWTSITLHCRSQRALASFGPASRSFASCPISRAVRRPRGQRDASPGV